MNNQAKIFLNASDAMANFFTAISKNVNEKLVEMADEEIAKKKKAGTLEPSEPHQPQQAP